MKGSFQDLKELRGKFEMLQNNLEGLDKKSDENFDITKQQLQAAMNGYRDIVSLQNQSQELINSLTNKYNIANHNIEILINESKMLMTEA